MEFDKRMAIRLLRLFCPKELLESILGDLEEQHEINKVRKTGFHADLLLLYNVIRFLRPGILKRHNYTNNMYTPRLLQNFLLVFLRSARRNAVFYTLNLTGMILGFSIVLFVLLYVTNETSYDQFHPDSKYLYRVTAKRTYGPWFPHIDVKNAKKITDGEYAWTKTATRFSRVADRYVFVEGKRFAESRVLVLESGDKFFQVFGYDLKYGDRQTVTAQPNSIIISESHAQKYFGDINPIGKSVHFDSLLVNVSGVFKDLPTNTHMVCDILLVSNEHFATKSSALVYFLVDQHANIQQAENDILTSALAFEKNTVAEVKLQNIEDIHLGENFTFDLSTSGNKEQIRLYSVIAMIVLLISCINFTNLSTAIFTRRKKEMAIRKILGSSKSDLSRQFLMESICLCLISLLFVYSINSMALPFFNSFIGIQFDNDQLFDPRLTLTLIAIAILCGTLSGIYPSVVMTRISALNLFKPDFKFSRHKIPLRKALVTLQFIFLIGLSSGALLVKQQLSFLSESDTGFDKEGVLKLKRVWSLDGVDRIRAFKTRLLSQSYIHSVSQGYAPGDEDYPTTYLPEGYDYALDDALSLGTDLEYLNVLGIEGKYGPFFHETEHPEVSLLVNEKLVRNLQWKDPIGKKIKIRPESSKPVEYTIRGVYGDFNFFSLHEEIRPQMMFMREKRKYVNQNILVKINLAQTQEALEWIEKVWDEFLPDRPLHVAFLDEDIQRAYEQDRQTSIISTLLTSIAIMLSVLGLIGITAFQTSIRTKELGIRKVLGASISSLLIYFNKEYILPVAIAILASSVIGYIIFTDWLNNFAYHISVNPLVFLLTGVLVLVITFVTVSFISFGVVKENPIKALRSE